MTATFFNCALALTPTPLDQDLGGPSHPSPTLSATPSSASVDSLLCLVDHLVANCFRQNPTKKSNTQAHLRIVYLRALLNLLKALIRLLSAKP